MKITEEEMMERRKNMICTAFHLFCKRGIDNVTLMEIAKNAGYGESTIYRYFDNKTTLILEAFIKLWDLIMSDLGKNVESADHYEDLTGYEQIKVWIESFRELYQNDSDFVLFSYEAKLYLLRHNIKLDEIQQDTMMHAIKRPCLQALQKGIRDGTIPIKYEMAEDIFYAIWGSIRGYIVKIVIYDSLYGAGSPWESRYKVMEKGILSALRRGWDGCEN